MGQLIQFNKTPRVFTAGFIQQLAIANQALRQLRGMEVTLLSCDVSESRVHIIVNRNPHQSLSAEAFPGVSVTHNFSKKEK
ncbi:MAG: hypothetical protein LBQ75_08820 [Zoogloeaceae bacterium]|jgi:hypothetical protein|nr:hypothetical protein [Zoogloeaceae bacterium]